MGAVISGFGAWEQGQAQAASAKYNAKIADRNAVQAHMNATMASQAGSADVAIQGEKNKAELGQITANQGASNVDVHSGSAADTQESAHEIGMTDALNVRTRATKEAYGYQVQEQDFHAKAEGERAEASNDLTGSYVNAASTFLNQTESSASAFGKYALSGGMSA